MVAIDTKTFCRRGAWVRCVEESADYETRHSGLIRSRIVCHVAKSPGTSDSLSAGPGLVVGGRSRRRSGPKLRPANATYPTPSGASISAGCPSKTL